MTATVSTGAYVPDGIIREVVRESNLQGASKSQVLRFALLRLIMSSKEARLTIFGNPDEITETNGRIDAKIPVHEVEMIRNAYPDISLSELARYGLEISRGEAAHEALRLATSVKRGRKPTQSEGTAIQV